jgi:hypothetical protein
MNQEKQPITREYEILPFPSEREIVIDAGRLASRRHIIHALIEVDVTRARELLRVSAERRQDSLSSPEKTSLESDQLPPRSRRFLKLRRSCDGCHNEA